MTRLTEPDFRKMRKEYTVVPLVRGRFSVFHGDRELTYPAGSISSKASAIRLIDGDIRARTLVQRATQG